MEIEQKIELLSRHLTPQRLEKTFFIHKTSAPLPAHANVSVFKTCTKSEQQRRDG